MASTAELHITYKGESITVLVDREDLERIGTKLYYCGGIIKDANGKALHRIIAGVTPEMYVAHINGNKLDNRKENLRLLTRAEVNYTMRKHSDNKTGVKGVHMHSPTGKYCAQICVRGVTRNLGYFNTPEAAGDAYNAALKTALAA